MVVHGIRASGWSEYAKVLGPKTVKSIVDVADDAARLLGPHGRNWSEDDAQLIFGAIFSDAESKQVDPSALLFYLQQERPALIASFLRSVKPSSNKHTKSGKPSWPTQLLSEFPPIFELRVRGLLALENRTNRLVARSASDFRWAQASPNGRAIAFVSGETGGPRLYVTSLSARGPVVSVDTAKFAESAAWSQDSRYLAYLASDYVAKFLDFTDRTFDEVRRAEVCSSAGDVIRQPATTVLASLAPTSASTIAWLPGDRLLFATQARPAVTGSARMSLFTLRMQSQGVPDVLERTSGSDPSGWFAVSPDGNSLALADISGKVAIFSLSANKVVLEQKDALDSGLGMQPSWKDATHVTYVLPAWELPGGPVRANQVVVSALDGGMTPISQTWPTAIKGHNLENSYVIDVENDDLSPNALTVPVGSTVNWKNRDSHPQELKGHTAKFGFDSVKLDSGEHTAFTFWEPGMFSYTCSCPVHQDAQGTVIVTPTPPPKPKRTH
jgi:plastocyanin